MSTTEYPVSTTRPPPAPTRAACCTKGLLTATNTLPQQCSTSAEAVAHRLSTALRPLARRVLYHCYHLLAVLLFGHLLAGYYTTVGLHESAESSRTAVPVRPLSITRANAIGSHRCHASAARCHASAAPCPMRVARRPAPVQPQPPEHGLPTVSAPATSGASEPVRRSLTPSACLSPIPPAFASPDRCMPALQRSSVVTSLVGMGRSGSGRK